MTNRLEAATVAYFHAFKVLPPQPFAISDDRLAEVLEEAVHAGEPIPENFDWWSHLPPEALA